MSYCEESGKGWAEQVSLGTLPSSCGPDVSWGCHCRGPCWARCPTGSFLCLHWRLPVSWELSWCSLSLGPPEDASPSRRVLRVGVPLP